MPAYTPKFTTTAFKSGKNILASEHLQFIEAGATLDAAAIGAKTLDVGTLIARNKTSGKWVVFAAADVANYDSYGILNIDVIVDGTNDLIVGEVIVRGSVYEAKLPALAADLTAFKPLVPLIRFVKHI